MTEIACNVITIIKCDGYLQRCFLASSRLVYRGGELGHSRHRIDELHKQLLSCVMVPSSLLARQSRAVSFPAALLRPAPKLNGLYHVNKRLVPRETVKLALDGRCTSLVRDGDERR